MALLQLKECGKIFLSTDLRLYALDCYYCRQLFTHWEQFLVHVKDKHFRIETKDFANETGNVEEDKSLETNKNDEALCEMVDTKILDSNFGESMKQNLLAQTNDSTDNDIYLDVEYIIEEEADLSATNKNETEETNLENHTDTNNLSQINTENVEQTKSSAILTFETASYSVMLDFIEGLRYFECLWNINSKDYTNFVEREAALKTLSEMLNLEISSVQKSISHLRSWYKQRRKLNEDTLHTNTSSISNEQLIEYVKLCEFLNPRLKRGEFKCNLCDKVFSLKKYLDVHRQRHQKELPFQCYRCPKRAATSTEIVTHLRVHTGEKPYKCRFCGETFKTSSSLCVHERKHGEPTIQCSFCPKAFYTNYQLKNHINVHLNVRNYKCNSCAKSFITAKTLYSHNVNVHWKKDGERNLNKKEYMDVT